MIKRRVSVQIIGKSFRSPDDDIRAGTFRVVFRGARVGDIAIGPGGAAQPGRLKNVLATYNEAEDLINIGAYKNGSNPNIDYAIEKIEAVNSFLMQMVEDKFTFEESVRMMEELFEE